MIKFIRIAVLLALLFSACAAFPRDKTFPCTDAKTLMKKNFTDGFAYAATAVENNGYVVQLYLNISNLDWRIIGIDSKGNACIMLSGADFTAIKIVKM